MKVWIVEVKIAPLPGESAGRWNGNLVVGWVNAARGGESFTSRADADLVVERAILPQMKPGDEWRIREEDVDFFSPSPNHT